MCFWLSDRIFRSSALALIFSVLLPISCQSKLKVRTVPPKDPPAPAEMQPPIEKPGTSRAVREINYSGADLVAQTASINRLRISADVANDAIELLLGHTDDSRQLSLNISGTKECGSHYCYELPSRLSSGESPPVMFLNYGVNNLKLVGVTATEDLTSKLRITLNDFQVFGLVFLRSASSTTGQPALAPAGPGALQSISLLTVAVPVQSGEPQSNPLTPVMISNWQEAVQRP